MEGGQTVCCPEGQRYTCGRGMSHANPNQSAPVLRYQVGFEPVASHRREFLLFSTNAKWAASGRKCPKKIGRDGRKISKNRQRAVV